MGVFIISISAQSNYTNMTANATNQSSEGITKAQTLLEYIIEMIKQIIRYFTKGTTMENWI